LTYPPYFNTVISGIAAPNGKLLFISSYFIPYSLHDRWDSNVNRLRMETIEMREIRVRTRWKRTYVPAGAKNPSFSFPASVTFLRHPSAS